MSTLPSYHERGTGPAVVLVHGIGVTAAAWAPEIDALAPRARVIAYDRRGYGATPAPAGYAATTVLEQGEDLVAVIEAVGARPAVLAGRDFGALACLDVLLRHPDLVVGAVLEAPPLYSLVPEAAEVLTAERIALGEKLHSAGPRAAMEAWLGHESEADPAAFFADWTGLPTLAVTRRALGAIAAPVVVLTGSAPEPHVRAAAAALARAIPGARLEDGEDVPAADIDQLLAEIEESYLGRPPV